MTSNPVLETIYARRSIRSYSDKEVSDDIIRQLIDAGFHAANGVNAQKLRFAVVTNKEKLKEYSDRGKVLYLQYMKEAGFENPRLEENLKNSGYNIFFDAPAAIFVFGAPGILTAVEDAGLAMANMMLLARSRKMGTCWIGLAAGLGNDKGFLKDLNVPEDHKFLATLILGYPKTEQGPSVRPEPTILNWVR